MFTSRYPVPHPSARVCKSGVTVFAGGNPVVRGLAKRLGPMASDKMYVCIFPRSVLEVFLSFVSGTLYAPPVLTISSELMPNAEDRNMNDDRRIVSQAPAENAACLFPVLNADSQEADASQCVAVRIDGVAIAEFSAKHGATPMKLLQVAWGIVLRSYTDNDRPWYLCKDNQVSAVYNRSYEYSCLDFSEDHDFPTMTKRLTSWTENAISCRSNTAVLWHCSSGLVADSRCVHSSSAFDVGIELHKLGHDSSLSLQYKTSILSESQATGLAHLISHIVSQLIRDPISLGSIDLCPHEALEQLTAWNGKTPKTINRCIHHLVLEQSEAHPEAPAVCAWDGDLSYHDVARLSKTLSRYLASHGIGPETFVGLYFDKSKWTVVSLLAVLRAGGAFVLLDTSFPQSRLAEMCMKLGARLILCPRKLVEDAAAFDLPVIPVDEETTTGRHFKVATAIAAAKPHNAAFAVFTSGSTGTPKGIIFNHSSFCSGQCELAKAAGYHQGSRVLQFASYAFDASVNEHLTTLVSGGCVCIPSESASRSKLAETMKQMDVNLALLTPTVARLLRPADVPSLETLILGGEPLLKSDVATWHGRLRLFNGYGPAECCIFAATHLVRNDGLGANIIGSGVGARFWVVEPSNYQKLAPIGGIGELLIEGPIVGRGYLGDDKQTRSRFVSDLSWRPRLPVPGHSHCVMYRTGDLVQWVGNGSLRYIGRSDSQAKVHGQRLEPGEVERNLHQVLPEGYQALVAVLEPADDSENILAGFVVWPRDGGSDHNRPESLHGMFAPPSDDFREFAERAIVDLASRLPRYMVPRAMIPLTAIPTTPTGKSDRRELIRLASKLTKKELGFFLRSVVERRVPRSENEELLHKSVEHILRISDFGMNDSFFNLGGDSISAMRLARQMREDGGLELTLDNVFKNPVLSDLALTLRPCDEHNTAIPPFSLMPDAPSVDEVVRAARDRCRLSSTDEIEDVYPCTPLQEAIMAVCESSPEATYVTTSTYRLPRAIAVDQLKAAWNVVIASNPILRTRIVQGPAGQPLQVVLKEGVEWQVATDSDDLQHKHGQWRIGLGGPLLRLMLLRSPHGNCLCVFISHALYDGWSLPETLAQVEAAYYGGAVKSTPFKHFVRHLAQADAEKEGEFWEGYFADFSAPPFPNAPAAKPNHRPVAASTLKRTLRLADSSTSLSTVVSLAWALTVSQHSGSDDVCFGTTLAGRNVAVPSIDRILGPTITTIPLRLQLDGSHSVQHALSLLQRQFERTRPYEHTGLQRIATFGPNAAAACRFQNHLVIQPPRTQETSTIFAQHDTKEIVDQYMLSLEVTLPSAGSSSLQLETAYDERAVPQWLMSRIADQLCHNLVEMVSNSAKRLCDLDALDPAGLDTIVCWNRRLPKAVECCVHDLVGRQCLGQPDCTAVDAFDGSLTYGDLDRHAERLAAYLQTLGARPGAYIMVMMERSLWAVVAMMAVIKSGAAFVMVDPSTPSLRLQQIRDDTEPALIIASPKHAGRASDLGRTVIARGNEGWMKNTLVFSPPAISPDDIVYAVFTSGSTGRPKGIAIQHRALATAATINGSIFEIDRTSRVFHISSFNFDTSIAEIFYTLVYGGCICIPSEADSRNNLEDAMNRLRVTWASLTPSLARALAPSKIRTLQVMALGGEAITKADIDMWAVKLRLMNGYGPAECTIDSTIQPDIDLNSCPPSIGFGAATVPWVVDPNDPTCSRLAPIGAIGELVLEGPVLAKGYLKDPAKTASSFVEYPDWLRRLRRGRPGRLYRTGDLTQYSPMGDGSLVYMGRKDNQVKLRGQRIELGEVEQHVLGCLPTAREAIAELVRPCDADIEPALAVFVLFRDNHQSAQLHDILGPAEDKSRKLFSKAEAQLLFKVPAYMIPSLFLPLAQIPLSPTGKLNRRLLRETASALSRKQLKAYSMADTQKRPPAGPKERAVQKAVCAVLRLPPEDVGMYDNFFQLGGDSLSAMKAAGMVQDAGFVATVGDILSYPRLGDLAAQLRERAQTTATWTVSPFELLNEAQRCDIIRDAASRCGVSADVIEDIYPCTPMQEGLVALTMKQQGQYVAEMTFVLPGHVDIDVARAAWKAVYAANPILRTRIISTPFDSGSSLQVVIGQALEWSLDSAPLEVEDGKPLHKAIIVTKDGHRALRLWLHHALYDGASLPLLLEQAEAALNGVRLSPKPFNAFVAYTQSIDAEASKQFWQAELQDLNATMFPPQSYRRSSGKRESVSREISVPDTPGVEFTLPSVIHTACATTLAHYANTEDVVYGLTLAGRSAPVPEIEDIVGPTIATVPFRVLPAPSKTVRQLLAEIQGRLARVMPFEQTGLRAIRSFCPECAAACNFHCQLVIQPADERGQDKGYVFKEHEIHDDEYSRFSSTPLLLVFTMSTDRRSVRLVANFDAWYLSAVEAASFARQLDHTIHQILQDADAQVQQVQAANQHDILLLQTRNAWVPPKLSKLVHDLVTEQCRLRPSTEAVCSWDGSLTYEQLDDASSRLVQHLMAAGIGTSPMAALCMPKSRWAVVAMLAILKSGAACALMDASHPQARLREMTCHTGAALILASHETRAVAEGVAVDTGATVIVVSPDLLYGPSARPFQTPRVPSPSDAALIVFTSGSTGKPKGIVLEHASIATGLRDLCKPVSLDEESRVLHFASYAFDASFFEVLGCLYVGGCLCIPSETERTSNLEEFIEAFRVTWALMIPSTTRLLDPSGVPTLKTLVIGGEVLKSADLQRWAARKDLRLLNFYGPAECTIGCALGHIVPPEWTPGLIGPVVSGVGWIVSPCDPSNLCAVGAIGELLIEGPILAREYIGDREKTASCFISSPPWLSKIRGHAEGRLYRTGDLVQYTSNGHIRYISRKDRQLKMNGQRIEPQEVESCLAAHFPDDATVVVDAVVPDSPGTRPRLFAFIRLAHASPADGEPLFAKPSAEFLALCHAAKQGLEQSLPRYMVPHTFVALGRVPRTSSGKINYGLLSAAAGSLQGPELDSLSKLTTRQSRAMSNAERLMATLWSGVLGLPADSVGADDNFFHLGGDSILAMKLVAAARPRGLEMTVAAIFALPRLADMASSAAKLGSQANDTDPAIAPFSLIPKKARKELVDMAERLCSVPRARIDDIYPCTPLQEALISQSMCSPGAYLARFRYRLAPGIDSERLALAWGHVVKASPILRTRMMQTGSAMYQVVLADDTPCEIVDVDSLQGFESRLQREGTRLASPLLQLVLSRPRERDAQPELCLFIHHALYDGWSLQLILNQVQQAFAGSPLVTQSFNRFMYYISKQNQEDARTYWLTQLSDASGVVFPALPKSGYKPFADARVRQEVDIMAVSDNTPATVLELSWAVTVSQYCDSADATYGLVLSGRNAGLAGIEAITGPTITTVPVHFVPERDAPILHELRRLQCQRAAVTPFEQFGLQNIRRLSSQAEAACQFQNLLLIQQAKTASVNGLLEPVEDKVNAGDFSAYALEVTCEIAGGTCIITFDYDSNVLDGRQARRVLAQFVHTLEQVQAHSEKTLADLDLVAPSAWQELSQWNRVLPDCVDRCIHEGIKEQCLRAPDAEAVCAWDGSFTYRELRRLSCRLASHLQQVGVGPEVFVPILMEKSVWVAICVLSVVEAGGAIVLLDPALPQERLKTICSSVGAKVILASHPCLDLAKDLAPTTIAIGGRDPWIPNADSIAAAVSPHNALYAIFTSGSTGKPKGIVVSHAAFYTNGLAQQAPLYLDGDTRTLQFAPHMFDVSVADYLWTFLMGGCVCVASKDDLQNHLASVINEFRVNRADLTPSVARIIYPGDTPTLRTLLLGGESMGQRDVDMWAAKVRLVNGYGPSECSVCCTLADVSVDADPSTIGHTYGAVPWVVDKNDHNVLLPIGSIGELVLEGHTLAREYLGEPDKTAAAFIEGSPPWLRELRPSSRLYKTGDLVQYNADGTLRYVGRKDTQVKIRGQRVELGEIEQQVREASPSARDVVVEVVRPTQEGLSPLLAVFFSDLTASNSGDLGDSGSAPLFLPLTQRHREEVHRVVVMLKNRLPTYMIPDVMIPLSFVPLSANGKADRRLLRDEAAALTHKQMESYKPRFSARRRPSSEAEEALQAIVADVLSLDVEDVGMDDSFFQLGGDSIIAIRLVERARSQGFNCLVSSVFQSPKLADLARYVVQSDVDVDIGTSDTASPFELLDLGDKVEVAQELSSRGFSCSEQDIHEILPVTQAAERYLFQAPEYWIVNLWGPIDLHQLQQACTALVLRHGILRTVFVRNQDRFLQVVLNQVDAKIQHRTTLAGIADFVEDYRHRDAIAIPTLDVPITNFELVQSSGVVDPTQALVVRLSHAQFDGFCLHTIWRDLKYLYEGVGLAATVPYSYHLRQWGQAQTDEAFAFWRGILAGASVSRIDNTSFGDASNDSADESVFVSSTRNVYIGDVMLHGITAATVVKVAWAAVLAQLSGSRDCVFAQCSNGRNYESAHEIVGMCLNLIPVRAQLNPGQTVRALLEAAQQQHCRSLAFELLNFRDIVCRATPWPRGTTHQSALVHQNIDPDELFGLGAAEAWVTCSYEWPHPPDEILVESRPTGAGTLQMTLDTRSNVLSQRNADAVVAKLCHLIALLSGLAGDPEARVGALLGAMD